MKYLPLQSLEDVADALNFDTPDLHVVGCCDIYTTKAAGGDKKLYKNIEHSLESQYESLLRFSASLSPPQAIDAAAALNLSRSSPFGPLSQISSRRTFAYLIATLNASHPDYDISNQLRPTDFRREKSLRLVMNTLDTTLQNLRPKPLPNHVGGPPSWTGAASSVATASAGISWSPKMWRAIDKEMSLRECSIYSFAPEDDPYDDDDEPTLWSLSYFFFNKARKRVCYVSLRGISILSQSPVPRTPLPPRPPVDDSAWLAHRGAETGASKRAQFWLGDRFDGRVRRALDADEDDEMHDAAIVIDDDDVGSPSEPRLLPARSRRSTFSISDVASPESESSMRRSESKGPHAGDDEVVGAMEV